MLVATDPPRSVLAARVGLRLATILMVLPVVAVANDEVMDRVEGRTYCLDRSMAATSVEMQELLCISPDAGWRAVPRADVDRLLD